MKGKNLSGLHPNMVGSMVMLNPKWVGSMVMTYMWVTYMYTCSLENVAVTGLIVLQNCKELVYKCSLYHRLTSLQDFNAGFVV